MIVAGIDPGLKGALAIADLRKNEGGQFDLAAVRLVIDLPITQVDNGKLVDTRKLLEILEYHEPKVISLEWPGPRTSRSSKGNPQTEWRFALGCGATLAACQIATERVTLYSPNSWKSALGVTADKATSINLARSLVDPATASLLKVSKDGRSEAILLIEHLRRRLNEGFPLITS